jgi:hypothetical protein
MIQWMRADRREFDIDQRRRRRLSQAELTPEQQAAVEARRAYRQTPEYQEDLARDIEVYRREYPPAAGLHEQHHT